MQSWFILITEYYITVVESWTSISVRFVNEYRRTLFCNVNDIGRILIRVSLPMTTIGMRMQCLRVDGCCGRVQWVLKVIEHYREESVHQETDSRPLRQNGNSAWSICCGKVIVEEWSCCLVGRAVPSTRVARACSSSKKARALFLSWSTR